MVEEAVQRQNYEHVNVRFYLCFKGQKRRRKYNAASILYTQVAIKQGKNTKTRQSVSIVLAG